MKKLKFCLTLFLSMLTIGAFTFGGGIAMLALLENEFVSKKKLMEKDEFLNMTAIAESTPGPIAINAATYIGYKQCGILGSVFATIGVVIPSFIIIFIISLFFDAFLEMKLIAYAFQGIRAAVVYLILSAGIKMLKGKESRRVLSIVLITLTIVSMLVLSLFAVSFSSIFYILIGGVVGVFSYLRSLIHRPKDEKGRSV